MKIDLIKLVCFSPTGTTKKIMEGIAKGISTENIEIIDFTKDSEKNVKEYEINNELVIIGAPVYFGRVQIDAATRFKKLKANNTPAILVVTYGNVDYKDALIELKDIAVQIGFRPIAGCAFIGEHSFSNDKTPIAQGRPDAEDIEKAVEFGYLLKEKIDEVHNIDDFIQLIVPGNSPYTKGIKMPRIAATTNKNQCTKCGKCEKICPTGAIKIDDEVNTNKNKCILCHACVKNCTTGSRGIKNLLIKMAKKKLSKGYQERKEPEIYI